MKTAAAFSSHSTLKSNCCLHFILKCWKQRVVFLFLSFHFKPLLAFGLQPGTWKTLPTVSAGVQCKKSWAPVNVCRGISKDSTLSEAHYVLHPSSDFWQMMHFQGKATWWDIVWRCLNLVASSKNTLTQQKSLARERCRGREEDLAKNLIVWADPRLPRP